MSQDSMEESKKKLVVDSASRMLTSVHGYMKVELEGETIQLSRDAARRWAAQIPRIGHTVAYLSGCACLSIYGSFYARSPFFHIAIYPWPAVRTLDSG